MHLGFWLAFFRKWLRQGMWSACFTISFHHLYALSRANSCCITCFRRWVILWFANLWLVLVKLVLVPIHTIVRRKFTWYSFCKGFLKQFALFLTMTVCTNFFLFFTSIFVCCCTIRAIMHFVVKRVEQDFNECVTILAIHLLLALNPALLVIYLAAPFRQIIEVLRGSSEVLHSVSVIAIRPIVLFIKNWAKWSFVAIE